MQIPDHLVELIQQLAAANLLQAAGDLRLIESHRSPEHPNVREARDRLARAGDLVAHVGQSSRAAA